MNTRERFKSVVSFQPVDRLPAIEAYWWWDKTLERWYAEGLPAGMTDHPEVAEYLGLDVHRIAWLTPRSAVPRYPGRERGRGIIDTVDDYDRMVKPHLDRPVVDRALLKSFAECQDKGRIFLWLQIDGFFWFPREVLGIERHFLAFYDEPDFLLRVNDDLCQYTLRLLEEVVDICRPDVISFAEDMSYNHGPMLSRNAFDEFLAPFYRRLVGPIKAGGAVPIVDSDGGIASLIPWLESVGLEGLSPLERRAGNDLVAIRKAHPRFILIGGFDKTVMHLGESAMRKEFERLMPVMQSGGYIPCVDHQTPPDVSMENYRMYVSLLKEYCSKAIGESQPMLIGRIE